jgi:hypothetical protein
VRRVVEQRADVLQREAQLPPDEDLLQLLQVRVRVQAITGVRVRARHQQPDLVVVMKRADADARQGGELTDGVHAGHRRASPRVRVKS